MNAPVTDASATVVSTPDGPFVIIATRDAVIASGWSADVAQIAALIPAADRPAGIAGDADPSGILASAAAAVEAFYSGDAAPVLQVPVRQRVGAFHQAVRDAMRAIPAGETVSYGELAAHAGNPAAARAAAAACATNATALFLPCHRVVRSDGSLGGFGYGLGLKRALLEREGTASAAGR